MAAPIRSSVEIAAILNKGKNAIGDIGHDIIGDAKRGDEFDDLEFRDKAYRLIFLRGFIKNIVDPSTGEINAYYSSTTNEKKLNVMLDAIVQLTQTLGGPNSIPLIQGPRIPVVFYPSTSGASSAGGGTGGTASPGGITFQNVSVSAPGEVVDSWDASANTFAFYLVEAIGSGVGEGSGFWVVSVSVRGSNTPVLTTYHSGGIGGSIAGVSFSAALNGGQLELTANVPTDGWLVRGTRIQFENISFQNVLGPLPTGGTVGQYLRKSSSTDYDAAFAAILISEVTGLSTALASFLLLAGGTMAGAIAMGNNQISGLPGSSSNGQAVRHEQLALKANVAQGAWTTITLINGWTGTIQYRTNTLGMVSLRGVLDSSAASNANAAFAQLPAPDTGGYFSFVCPSDGLAGLFRQVNINFAGTLSVPAFGASDLVDVTGIHYWTP